LLAYGGLKKRLLEAVIDAPSPGPVEASAVAASKAQILTEASDALIDAGLLPQSSSSSLVLWCCDQLHMLTQPPVPGACKSPQMQSYLTSMQEQ